MEAVGSTLVRSQGSLEEAVAAVSRMGFRLVEIGVQSWCDFRPQALVGDYEGERARLQGLLDKYGLVPVAFNAGLGEDWLEEAQAIARLAAELSVAVVTTNPSSPESDLAEEAARLNRLVGIFAAQGVQVTLETHMFSLTEQPETARQLAAQVEGLGLTLDISHYYCNETEGQIGSLLPYVKHVHIRDCGRGWENIQLPYGTGLLDLERWAAELRSSGYTGHLAVEYIDLAGVAFAVEEASIRCKAAIEATWGGE